MCASPSKDFVWAKEGLREIDQVININNTELSSGPVPHCGPIIYQMFESLARCLWSFENVYIDGYAQFRIPVNFNRRLAVLYLPKPSCYPSGFTFLHFGSNKRFPRRYHTGLLSKLKGEITVFQMSIFYLKFAGQRASYF